MLALGTTARPATADRSAIAALSLSTTHLYSGEAGQSYYYTGASHDARFNLGLAAAYRSRSETTLFSIAAHGGGRLTAQTSDQRGGFALATLIFSQAFAERHQLDLSLDSSITPLTISEDGSTDSERIAALFFFAAPRLDLSFGLSERDRLSLLFDGRILAPTAYSQSTILDDPRNAGQLSTTATLAHNISPRTTLSVSVRQQLVGASTPAAVGIHQLIGLQLALSRRITQRLVLDTGIGVAHPFDHQWDNLWPVEPEGMLSLRYQPTRQQRLEWRVELGAAPNPYLLGAPQRVWRSTLYWVQRGLTRWGYGTSLSYRYADIARVRDVAGVRTNQSDAQHTVRLSASLVFRGAGALRFVLAPRLAYAQRSPEVCNNCLKNGVYSEVLLRMAYLWTEHKAAEQLLDSVW